MHFTVREPPAAKGSLAVPLYTGAGDPLDVQYLRRIAEVEMATMRWIEWVVDRSSRFAEAAWLFPQLASGCDWRDHDGFPWKDRALVRDRRRRKHRSARRSGALIPQTVFAQFFSKIS